ncbi:MAG: hypothetical protein ACLQHL_07505, partial [Candidatus Cybelea sp.]
MKRMLTALASALIAVLIAGALSAGRACAHDPRFACSPRDTNDPVVVADPQKSWAFYGHLRAGEEDRYAIETPKAVAVPVQLLVDRRESRQHPFHNKRELGRSASGAAAFEGYALACNLE